MMKTNAGKWCTVGLVTLLLNVSCGDASLFDTDKWSDKIEGLEPNVKIKIGHGDNITVWDLLNQGDSSVIAKEGNDLFIQYTKENIYTISVSKVFDMPAENIHFSATVAIPEQYENLAGVALPDPVNFTDEVSSSLTQIPDGCELTGITASALLEYTLPAMGFRYNVNVTFLNVMKEGQPLVVQSEVPANAPVESNMSLDEIRLNLNGSTAINLSISVTIPKGEVIQITDIAMAFDLKNLQFIKAEGKIKVDPFEIEPGFFSMDVDFLDEIGGSFKFTKPVLNVILRNKGLNIPLRVEPIFNAQNSDNESVKLKLNSGQTLQTAGNKTVDTLSLNNQNSNVVEFLSLPPQGTITYGGKVLVNPDNRTDNIIYNDAEVALDAYVRVPFSLSAENLVYKDTIDDIDIGKDVTDKLKSGKLAITVQNGIPLELSLPALMLWDKDYQKGMEVRATGNGVIEAGGTSKLIYELSAEQIEMLGRTKNIILAINLKTKNGQEVDIKADSALSFSLSLEAQADITDFDF